MFEDAPFRFKLNTLKKTKKKLGPIKVSFLNLQANIHTPIGEAHISLILVAQLQ